MWAALSPVHRDLGLEDFCDYFLASKHLQLTVGKALPWLRIMFSRW